MTDQSRYVFVTGGSGFVGRHLVAELLRDVQAKPWREVIALARSDESAAALSALGATPVRGDLLDAGDDSWHAIARSAPYVVHCAHPSMQGDLSTRTQMDERLLSVLEPATGARAVFVFGSSYYGRTGRRERIDETMSPRRPIGMGYHFDPCIEALRAAGARGLDYAAAFVGGVYGPGSWFLHTYLDAIEKGQPIVLRDPAPIWPFIHIDDCSRAIEFLLRVDGRRLAAEGRDVIVVDDEPAPMDEFIERVAERVGKRPIFERLDEEALRARLPPAMFPFLSSDMAHSDARLRRLGFEHRYPTVREGIRSLP